MRTPSLILASTLLTAIAGAPLPALAQSAADPSDVVVMRRAVSNPDLDQAPSYLAGQWREGEWRYETDTPACRDDAPQVRTVECVSQGKVVDAARCRSQPPVASRTAGRHDACTIGWATASYGPWSSQCATDATRDRVIQCQRTGGTAAPLVLDDAQCTGTKPSGIETGQVLAGCTWNWVYGEYGPWSSTCSKSAVRTRTATCKRSDGATVPDDECHIRDIPQESLKIGPQSITTDCTGMLVNGGFEAGTSPWVLGGLAARNSDNRPNYAATAIHSGGWSMGLGFDAARGTVQQTINTTPGASYTLTAWVWQYGTSYVTVAAGGAIVAGTSLGNGGNGDWHQRTATFTAKATTTTIQFGHSGNGYVYVDDVVVAQTPTP